VRLVSWIVAGVLAFGPMSAALAYQPRVNFQLQCMGCHHADGAGEEGRVPSVRRTLVPFSGLAEGRDFVMRVPGVAQAPLSDADIAALLNWMVRNLSDVPVPATFVDYTADEVGRARHRPLAAVRDTRATLLGRISE
jgi:mono/diheme cytochrome c family protein